jgi:hypothetical protein
MDFERTLGCKRPFPQFEQIKNVLVVPPVRGIINKYMKILRRSKCSVTKCAFEKRQNLYPSLPNIAPQLENVLPRNILMTILQYLQFSCFKKIEKYFHKWRNFGQSGPLVHLYLICISLQSHMSILLQS